MGTAKEVNINTQNIPAYWDEHSCTPVSNTSSGVQKRPCLLQEALPQLEMMASGGKVAWRGFEWFSPSLIVSDHLVS